MENEKKIVDLMAEKIYKTWEEAYHRTGSADIYVAMHKGEDPHSFEALEVFCELLYYAGAEKNFKSRDAALKRIHNTIHGR